nr:MAG TPA: hypothetical protein [Caudoviricetes sp.]
MSNLEHGVMAAWRSPNVSSPQTVALLSTRKIKTSRPSGLLF